jgi:geranylgeranyl pyrophosphate synthase
MNAVKYLSDYVTNVEPFFVDFFKRERKIASIIDPLAVEVINTLEDFIKGGKKVRGALTMLGYQCVGGKDLDRIYPISMAVELMHSSLLIHDDFIDNDLFRRGKPTVHSIYSKKYSSHHGASISLIIGDLGIFLSNKLFAESGFNQALVTKALLIYEKLLVNTGYGEIMDIAFDFKKDITWEDIMKVRIYKTAHYTFALPLTVGAVLGGANESILDAVMEYSEPVGIAYQIRDDILGIFGDSSLTGKSNNSDILEGKMTLLYSKALENGSSAQNNFIRKWYGNKNIGQAEIDKIKKIIISTKSLEECQKFAQDLVKKGKLRINKITGVKSYKEVYDTLADYIISRER